MKVHVGIAGWSNPPSQKTTRRAAHSHLEHYAEHFSCVEINSSFYRPHRKATYSGWNRATPPQFRFSVKMPRTITHASGLQDTAPDVAEFFSSIEALQPKLGAVLMQFPPGLKFSAKDAGAFFQSVPSLHGTRLVCEPRHASWFTAAADALLDRLAVTRAAADPAICDAAQHPGGNRRVAYFRWHGSPHKYYSSYSDPQLNSLAAEVDTSGSSGIWCIFDNTARHAAWDNALRFAGLCAKRVWSAGGARRRRSVLQRTLNVEE